MDGQIVEKEETDCNIGGFWDLFILTFFNQSCWSLLFVTLNVTLGKHILSPRTNVLTYFSDVWLDGAKIAKKHVCDCLIPRGPSLSMKICAQREAGRRKPPRRRFSSLLSPSHGPSRFVTSHSRFALAFVRKTKRLRRRQCLRHVSGKLPTYPFHVILLFFYSLLQDSVVKIQARRELDHLALLDHLDQLDCLDHQARKAHNEIFYLKVNILIN